MFGKMKRNIEGIGMCELSHGNEFYNYYTNDNTDSINIAQHHCFIIESIDPNDRNPNKIAYILIDMRTGIVLNHDNKFGKIFVKSGELLGEITIFARSWDEFKNKLK